MCVPMKHAVCIRCGENKSEYIDRCGKCGFEPKLSEDVAISLMLASDFEFEDLNLPKSEDELNAIAQQIKAGKAFAPDTHDVQQLQSYLDGYSKFLRLILVGRGIPLIIVSTIVTIICVTVLALLMVYVR